MQYFDAQGRADPNGAYQFRDGKLVLRSGGSVNFDLMMCDSASGGAHFTDAKSDSDPPKSIDEALRQRFAGLAERQNTDVESLLAKMEQKNLEEIAADVAKSFISSIAGGGVAKHFSDAQRSSMRDSAITLAEISRRRAQAALQKSVIDPLLVTGAIRDKALADRYNQPSGSASPPADVGNDVILLDTAAIRDAARDARFRD
jgi:hypothetical protein